MAHQNKSKTLPARIFAVAVRFQNQDQFWISPHKNQGSFLFIFRKVEKLARSAKNDVFGNFSENLMVFR